MRLLTAGLLLLLVMAAPQLEAVDVAESHGISLFGDLRYPPDFKHLSYVNPDAPKGGTLRLAAIGTYDSLNNFILRGMPAAHLGSMFDSLMESVEDEPSSEYGLLAKTIRRPNDNSWVEFILRPEAKFRDGSPVTAEDVVWSFNTMREKGHPIYRAYYRDVAKAEVRDVHTVRFSFSTTENRELAMILGQFPVTSKAFFTQHDITKPGLLAPMGSGPYEVAEAVPGKFIRYRLRKDYWAKDLPLNRGRYNFDVIEIDYYRDETVAIEALKAGEYDFRQENIARLWEHAYRVPAVEEGRLVKTSIAHQLPTGMQGVFFNLRRPMFQDRRVRQAIALAFDYEWANRNLFYGSYTRSLSFFSNSDLASNGLPSPQEMELLKEWKDQLPENIFTTPFSLPVHQQPEDVRGSLLQARELLSQAGWRVRDGKLTNPSGEVMRIELLISMPSMERVLAPLVKNLERLGMVASIRMVDDAQYEKRMEQFDFDMTTLVVPQSLSPGNEQFDYWHSSKAATPGSRNYAGVALPAVDAMVEAIIGAKNRDSLRTATHALDRILLNEFICIPGWHLRNHRIVYWNHLKRPETSPPYGLGFPSSWWFAAPQTGNIPQ